MSELSPEQILEAYAPKAPLASEASKKPSRTVVSEMIAIATGIILTWVIFWAYLSWDNFSSHYGSVSLTARAKAATLFVLQIMSTFLLAYGGVMYFMSKERIYLWQVIIAAVLIVFAILSTALEWLST